MVTKTIVLDVTKTYDINVETWVPTVVTVEASITLPNKVRKAVKALALELAPAAETTRFTMTMERKR